MEDIAADVAPVDGDVTGDVRSASSAHGAVAAPPPAVGARDTHPGVRAIVSEGSTSALIPGLLTGRYNAAIIHLPVDDPELTIEPLFAKDLLLVTHGDHPLAGRGEMPLAELATHRLLLPPAGSALRRVLDRAARSVGVQLHAQAEIDGVRLLATLAVDGHGAAIVPATASRPAPASAGNRPELPPPVVALASAAAAAGPAGAGAVRGAARGAGQPGLQDAGRAPGHRRLPAGPLRLKGAASPSPPPDLRSWQPPAGRPDGARPHGWPWLQGAAAPVTISSPPPSTESPGSSR